MTYLVPTLKIDQGNTATKKKIYIQDANNAWVDFSDRLYTFPAIKSSMDKAFNSFGATTNSITLKNDDGFWDSPFPAMTTLEGNVAVWGDGNYAIAQLTANGKHSKIQLIEEYDLGHRNIHDKIIATLYIEDLQTSLSNKATLYLISPQKLLIKEKVDDIKQGNFWYQYAPCWFLLEKILQKVFGTIVDGKITLPDTFEIPKDIFTNISFPTTKYSTLGQPPSMIDVDNDGRFDGFANEGGVAQSIVYNPDNGLFYVGVAEKLWEFNSETLIYRQMAAIPNSSVARQYEVNINSLEDWKSVKNNIVNMIYNNGKIYISTTTNETHGNSLQASDSNYVFTLEGRILNRLTSNENKVNTKYLYMLMEDVVTGWVDSSKDSLVDFIYGDYASYIEPAILPFKQKVKIITEREIFPLKHHTSIKDLRSENGAATAQQWHVLDSMNLNDPKVLGKGAYSFFIKGFSQNDYYEEQQIPESEGYKIYPKDNYLMYSGGQEGIDKIYLNDSNYYTVEFLRERMYAAGHLHSAEYFATLGDDRNAALPNGVLLPYVNFNLEIVRRSLATSPPTIANTAIFKKFQTAFPLNALCMETIPTTEHAFLCVKEQAPHHFEWATTPPGVESDALCRMIIITLDQSLDPLPNENSYTLTADTSNNKDKAYWDLEATTVNPTGLFTSKVPWQTTGTLTDTNVVNRWFKFSGSDEVVFAGGVDGVDLLTKYIDLRHTVYEDVAQNTVSLYEVTDLGKNTIVNSRDNFMYPSGDHTSDTLTEVARTYYDFYYFDILDIKYFGSPNKYIITFFNRRAITSRPAIALFGIQIVTLDPNFEPSADLTNSIESNEFPFSGSMVIAEKLFYDRVRNIKISDEKIFFTIDNQGFTYAWDSTNKFQKLGAAVSDNRDLNTSSLAVLDDAVETNPNQLQVYGLSSPEVELKFSPVKSNIGKYIMWGLHKKLYSIVELADFSGMTAMSALTMLVDAMFYTMGFDKLGNIKIIREVAATEETTLQVSKFKDLKVRYNLKNIFNSISVIPFITKLGDINWNLNTAIRDQDTEIKLTLDINVYNNKPQDLKLFCVDSGYIGEFAEDFLLEYDMKAQASTERGSNVLKLTYTEAEDLSFPLPESGVAVFDFRYVVSRYGNTRDRNTFFAPPRFVTQRFKYYKKEYIEIGGISYVALVSKSDRVQGTDIPDSIKLEGMVTCPLFSFTITESPVIVHTVDHTLSTSDTIYVASVFGGDTTIDGIKVSSFLRLANSETNENTFKRIIAVDPTLNTIQLESAVEFGIPPGTDLTVLGRKGNTADSDNYIDFDTDNITDNTIAVTNANYLVPEMVIKFYDSSLDIILEERYTIMSTDINEDTNNVELLTLNSVPDLPAGEPTRYKIVYYFAPNILNTFYPVSNTGITLRVNAQWPSYIEQRSISAGESIEVEIGGLTLASEPKLKQSVISLPSIEKYGKREYPAYSSNKFIGSSLALAKALYLLSYFEYPKLAISIVGMLNTDLDFFVGNKLMLLEIYSERKFPFLPEHKETIRMKSITEKGKYVDVEGIAIEPYEK